MTLRTTPRPSLCAGRRPGDWSGLACAHLDSACALHGEASPAAFATRSAPGARRPTLDPTLPCRPDHTPRPAARPGPAFNPHSGSPAPRFCPPDL
jgi:hypothetical protein